MPTQIQEALLGGATAATTYTYDDAGRLASVTQNGTTTTFGYDPNGNRTQLNGVNVATYDAQDRMLTYGDNAYAYTAGGDLLTKTAPAGVTGYTYDLYGSLRAATLPDGTQLAYTIDPAHRRIGKSRNGALEQGFLYDGIHPVAELDGAGATVSIFQYGARGNVPESMSKAGVSYRFVVDHLGSVRLVINAATGAVAQSLSYDAWGNVTGDSNPGFQPFGYAGGLYDRDLKLVRFGARDYDPETGRWTTKDGAGLGGGLNLYRYAFDEPMGLIDSSGQRPDGPPLPWGDTNFRTGAAWGGILGALLDIGVIGGIELVGAFGEQAAASAIEGAGEEGLEAGEEAIEKELTSSEARSVRSLEQRMAEHIEKLEQYKQNPDAFDNKGFLKNAPSEAIRQRIIASRIAHLEGEIANFAKQIAELKGGVCK